MWITIAEISSSFTAPLIEGLADGFKTREIVDSAVNQFVMLMNSTKQANAAIFSHFADQVN